MASEKGATGVHSNVHSRLMSARSWRSSEPVIETKDFRQPPKPSGRRRAELEGIAREMGSVIESAMSRYMRALVQVELSSFDIRPFEDTVAEAGKGTWMVPLVAQGGDRAVLMLDQELQLHLISRLLGERPPEGDASEEPDEGLDVDSGDLDGVGAGEEGAGGHLEDEDDGDGVARAEPAAETLPLVVGPMSRAVIVPFLQSLLREINVLVRRERTDPFEIDTERARKTNARLMRSTDVLSVFRFNVDEGGGRGRIGLLVRTAVLAPLLTSDDADRHAIATEPRVRERLEQVVRNLDMKVNVKLGSASIDLESFLRLQSGDVLILDRRLGEALELSVNGQPMYAARPGRSGGRIAARIVERLAVKESS